MSDRGIRERGLHEALELLRLCIVDAGLLATPEGDDNQRRRTDAFIDSIVTDELPLLPAFHPVTRPIDDDWDELQMSFSYSFKNRPYEYHNGGLWPLITGFHAADLALRGRREKGLEFATTLHRANRLDKDDEAWSFPEFVHGKKLEAMGNRGQGWSAAAAILAERALDGDEIFSVGGDGIL